MNSQSIGKEIARQPGIVIWHGTPSDHSGAYHIILSVGVDGTPVEVGIENPDCCRLEIPGLLDSGWDAEPEKIVAEFFDLAKTCRPKNGIYFNKNCLYTIEDIEKQLRSFCPALAAYFNEPAVVPPSMDSCTDSLLIYSRIKNHIESNFYKEFFDPEKDMLEKLGAQFATIKHFMASGSDSEGFIQFITSKDWLRVDRLTDIFSFWLWDSTHKIVRKISYGG